MGGVVSYAAASGRPEGRSDDEEVGCGRQRGATAWVMFAIGLVIGISGVFALFLIKPLLEGGWVVDKDVLDEGMFAVIMESGNFFLIRPNIRVVFEYIRGDEHE